MNTLTTKLNSRTTMTRRLLASAAVLLPALVGIGASAGASVTVADDKAGASVVADDKAKAAVTAHSKARVATQYARMEQVNNRWAMNTGFDKGTFSADAQVQTWSWTHRDPHDQNSQWSWADMGGGYWQYKNRWSGLCLDVDPFNFAQLEQNYCNASDHGQHWANPFVGYVGGRDAYAFENRLATAALGKVMVAETRNAEQGSPVNLKAKNNNTSYQRWFFSYVTG